MKFDLVVIGGGSGGYAAASKASSLGLDVALIEAAQEMGGLCMLHGCMPSKTLIESANRLREIRDAKRFGIQLSGEASIDMAGLQKRRLDIVTELQKYRIDQIKEGDFTLIRGHAEFLNEFQLKVSSKQEEEQIISFRTAIIATGSQPIHPKIEGLEQTPHWFSRDALEAEELPKHLVVVGAGAIGCEMAHCFEGLGSQVTLLSRSPQVLKGLPEEVSAEWVKASRNRDIRVELNANTTSVSQTSDGIEVVYESNDEKHSITASHLLIATGRKPALENLKLEKADISYSEKGIVTQATCQTSRNHIFAVGDCRDGLQIVHLAVIEGEQAAQNASAVLHSQKLNKAEVSPTIFSVFTEPEVIHIGPDPETLNQRDDLERRREDLSEIGKALVAGIDHGFLEIQFEKSSRKLVSATAVGTGVIDFSHNIAVAIRAGFTVDDFLQTPHYHPTLSESWTYLS